MDPVGPNFKSQDIGLNHPTTPIDFRLSRNPKLHLHLEFGFRMWLLFLPQNYKISNDNYLENDVLSE